MIVHGNIRSQVEIDPIDVIEKLKDEEIGQGCWVFEKDGKYYRGYEVWGGDHSWDESVEITKEIYEYIQSLNNVLSYLKK